MENREPEGDERARERASRQAQSDEGRLRPVTKSDASAIQERSRRHARQSIGRSLQARHCRVSGLRHTTHRNRERGRTEARLNRGVFLTIRPRTARSDRQGGQGQERRPREIRLRSTHRGREARKGSESKARRHRRHEGTRPRRIEAKAGEGHQGRERRGNREHEEDIRTLREPLRRRCREEPQGTAQGDHRNRITPGLSPRDTRREDRPELRLFGARTPQP